MAAMVRLCADVENVVEETYRRKNSAELVRQYEYNAAVRIQAWFRATQVRSYIRHLNDCATLIQKTWRGFTGRVLFRIFLKTEVFIMKLNSYNKTVTKIQKVWRGFYTRKYIFDYYCRKRYLDALAIKNNSVRTELREYAEQQEVVRRRCQAIDEKRQREAEARRTHYLVSTVVQPGIYNSPFLPYPSPMEYVLASVRPLSHKKSKTDDENYPFDPAWQRYDYPKPKELPPLPDKPQGPFRNPEEVQQQRYRPFRPSLRVQNDYFSVEQARKEMRIKEWIKRIHDKRFVHGEFKKKPYEPLLHTTSKYGDLPYGTTHFREETIDKHVSMDPFKYIVPAIPIFDKLNTTYSRGEV